MTEPQGRNWDTLLEAFLRNYADKTIAEVHPKRSLDEILAEAAALLGPKEPSSADKDAKAARIAQMRENLKKSGKEAFGPEETKKKPAEEEKKKKIPRVKKFNEEFEGMTEDEKKAAELAKAEEEKKKKIGDFSW